MHHLRLLRVVLATLAASVLLAPQVWVPAAAVDDLTDSTHSADSTTPAPPMPTEGTGVEEPVTAVAPTGDTTTEVAPTEDTATEDTATEDTTTEDTATQSVSDLTLEASMNPAVVTQDELVTITLVVYNAGPDTDGGVMVTDVLPVGAVLQDAVTGLDADTGTLDVGTVLVDDPQVFEIPVMFSEVTGQIMATPTVEGTSSAAVDQANTAIEVLPTVPGGPAVPGPTSGGSSGSTATEVPGAATEPAGQTVSSSTSSAAPGEVTRGGGSSAGSNTGPGADQSSTASTSRPTSEHSERGDQHPTRRPGSHTDSPGPDRGDSEVTDAVGSAGGDGSAAEAEPTAVDPLAPDSRQAALLVLGIVLIAAGCVLLSVAGVRQSRFWG